MVAGAQDRLSRSTLARVPETIACPAYDPFNTKVGIVHFGPGAFHRAHQASFVERLLAQDPRWAICAVSLRSTSVRDALVAQDFLYTVAELAEGPSYRVLGSLREVLAARDQAPRAFARLIAPDTQIVTMTVTENGYCLGPDGGLDVSRPEIAHDLAAPHEPVSLIGWLVEALARRRAAGLKPFTAISCDNLSDNGVRLRDAVLQFAGERDGDLANWIGGEARFPRTMVDSIVPATDEALKARAAEALGLRDAAPVQREPFLEWVIEELPGAGGPDWLSAGVVVTRDIDLRVRAKLRLLNGAHSTLAYLGLLAGYSTVAEAMDDKKLADFVRAMMVEEIAPTIGAGKRGELDGYIESILTRFRNRGLVYRLGQIAWDGSQKLPYRILATVRDRLEADAPFPRLALAVTGWMRFVAARARDGSELIDPMAKILLDAGRSCTGDAAHDVELFLQLRVVFPDALAGNPRFQRALEAAYAELDTTFPSLLKEMRCPL